VMTVAEVVVDRVAGDSVTFTLAGRHNFVPLTGHTNESLFVEDWNPGAPLSERMAGCRVNQIGITMAPNDMARLQIGLVGQDATSDITAYYTAPAAPSTTPIVAGPTGQIRLGSADIAVVTGGSLQIAASLGTQDVIGANVTPDIYPAPIVVTGELSVLVQDEVEWNRFSAETEFAVWLKLNADTSTTAPFLSFYMGRCKYTGRAAQPQNGSIVQTLPFQALLPAAATGVEQTTILVQDSGAV
ncbi:MAG: phage tail tube protein, partial [Gemmatimonadota bacterium]